MPLSRWFSGGRPRLRERVVKGLQQARDGDVDGAIETITERFHDALTELQALQPPQDDGWLQLAPPLAYHAGHMPPRADHAEPPVDHGGDAATWHLVGRTRVRLQRSVAVAELRRAA